MFNNDVNFPQTTGLWYIIRKYVRAGNKKKKINTSSFDSLCFACFDFSGPIIFCDRNKKTRNRNLTTRPPINKVRRNQKFPPFPISARILEKTLNR